ncbi:FG-GAP-like repeat-containing protein [Sphingomonas kaistensis]|uniref:FG-GAP-like repeat-containing protein n=1 Tax=Sphingomonas kaistensis TaxID=298708 RepID=A0ABZ2G437_9SPHN
MSRLVAFEQFDISSLDLNLYLRTSVSSQLTKDAQARFAGVTYQDQFKIQSSNGTELVILGSNLALDASGRLVSGTVNFVGVVETSSQRLYWYTAGVNIGASAVYDAVATPSNTDELGLFATAFAGSDTVVGSVNNDKLTGFAGNDTITGGLGVDRLEGGDGNDTFFDSAAGLNGDLIADFNVGDRIIVSDATYGNFRGNVSGTTLNFTGGSLTLGSTLNVPLVVNAVQGGGVALSIFTSQFTATGSILVNDFAVGAGGWSSQDKYPRHIADVNGDGFQDIVGFGQSGVLVSFGSASGSFTGARLVFADFGQASGWSSDNQFHRELADVNGDGRADIVGFGIAGTLVSFARADGSFTNPILGIANFNPNNGWSSQDSFARATGDVNGDGKADIIGFGTAGTYVALGNGDGTFAAAKLGLNDFGVNQGWTSDNGFHRTVADVNGDGFDDIIGFGYAGALVALSKGDGTFSAPTLAVNNFGQNQGWSSQNNFARAVADVNGDGKADVVGFGIAGTFVAYGLDNGGFSAARFDLNDFGANQGWTNDNIFHHDLADINGDGTIDIVGFGTSGVLAGYNQGHWLI